MRDRTATGSATGSRSKTRTEPLSARSRPRMCLMSVVLPAPLAPTRPKTCPGGRDTLTESRAVVVPKRRVSLDTLMTDSLTLEPLVAPTPPPSLTHRLLRNNNEPATMHVLPLPSAFYIRERNRLGIDPESAAGSERPELREGFEDGRVGNAAPAAPVEFQPRAAQCGGGERDGRPSHFADLNQADSGELGLESWPLRAPSRTSVG